MQLSVEQGGLVGRVQQGTCTYLNARLKLVHQGQ